MKQRRYIASLNRDRLRTIHDLIDRLVPIAPLSTEAVANLKNAAITCGAEISGTKRSTRRVVENTLVSIKEDQDHEFYDVPKGETEAARRKLKRLLNPSFGKRRGFIK
jgi:hypothetical protein